MFKEKSFVRSCMLTSGPEDPATMLLLQPEAWLMSHADITRKPVLLLSIVLMDCV